MKAGAEENQGERMHRRASKGDHSAADAAKNHEGEQVQAQDREQKERRWSREVTTARIFIRESTGGWVGGWEWLPSNKEAGSRVTPQLGAERARAVKSGCSSPPLASSLNIKVLEKSELRKTAD